MSLYRVATANMYDRTIQNISQRQGDLIRSQEQLSSGKRVLRASDDAVAATLAERAQNRLARVQADLKALEASKTALTQAESGLGEAGDLLQRARELVVQAGNPTLTPAIREDLAKQIEGLREQMLAVANRQDTNGLTLFGGLGGADKPFVDVYGPGAGVSFLGQAGQYAATENSLPQAIDGDGVWMRVPQGNGVFVVQLDSANQGQVRTDVGRLNSATVPAALTPPAGLGYQVSFGGTRAAPTFTIEEVTARDPVTNLPTATTPLAPPLANQPYLPGTTVSFDGVDLVLSGDLLVIGDPNSPDSQADPVPFNQIYINPVQAPTDLFRTMQDAIDALRYGGANQSAHITQELDRVLTEMDAGQSRILDARGRAGDWLNRADSLEDVLSDKSVFHQKEKSEQEDLDMVKGISDFENQQVALQAALQSYAQVQKLSLFQYIA